MIFDIEEARGAIRALQQFADADKIPAFPMRHRRVGDALEKMRAGDDAFKELVRTRAHQPLRGVALYEEIKAIDLLPHFAGDLFAGGPRIFARAGEARVNRIRILLLEADEIDHRLAVRSR